MKISAVLHAHLNILRFSDAVFDDIDIDDDDEVYCELPQEESGKLPLW